MMPTTLSLKKTIVVTCILGFTPFIHSATQQTHLTDLVNSWEKSHNAKVEVSVKAKILEDVRVAVERVEKSGKYSAAKISASTNTALIKYLDSLVSSQEVPEYLSLLMETIEPGGIFPRWPKMYPVISVNTIRLATAIVINGTKTNIAGYKPPLQILVPIGDVVIEMFSDDGTSLCRFRLRTEGGQNYRHTCPS